MTRDILAFIGGVMLCGFGPALVYLAAISTDGHPFLACLSFACGVLSAAAGIATVRCAVEVLRDRR